MISPIESLPTQAIGSLQPFESDADPGEFERELNQAATEKPAPPRGSESTQESRGAPAPAAPTAWVKTQDTRVPTLPRFSSVPEAVKFPLGPYRQAPAEHGGDWWLVNPFTGGEPWANLTKSAAAAGEASVEAPPEFVELFGERPTPGSSKNRESNYSSEIIRWEQDLKYFKQTGTPEGFTQDEVQAASEVFKAWGLGEPAFYEGRYGWRARFESGYESNPHTAITTPHLVVAGHQIRMAQNGIDSSQHHPFVPDRVWDLTANNA